MEESNNSKNMPFSKAELRVVDLMIRGLSMKEIADRLHLSVHTVNGHIRHIKEKNNLSKNTEVILLYIAYWRKKKFSLQSVREIGLSAILVLLNICDYTKIDL